jgi:hypothetical protein
MSPATLLERPVLVGGIPTPLKNMSSSMGRIIPYVMEKQKMKTQTSIEYVYIEVASFRGPL